MSDLQDGDFPQVEPADPASIRLPAAEPGVQPAFDTGSDAWYRAQAAAHDLAAQAKAPAAATPLDNGWLPADLAAPSGSGNGPDADTDELPLPVLPAAEEPPVIARLPPPAGVPRRRLAATELPAASYAGYAGSAGPVQGRGLPAEPLGRGGAFAGAGLALAGVCLGIGALLWLDNGSSGDASGVDAATVALPPAGSTGPASSAPSLAPANPSTPVATARPGTAAPVPTSPPVTPQPVVVPPPAPARPAVQPLTVLNNSRYSGLAQRAASRFRAGGWSTPVVGNLSGRIPVTTVYYSPGQLGSAQRLAQQFGIARVLPRFAGLPGRGLTVVLTRDFA